jgi:hypothetical protein
MEGFEGIVQAQRIFKFAVHFKVTSYGTTLSYHAYITFQLTDRVLSKVVPGCRSLIGFQNLKFGRGPSLPVREAYSVPLGGGH